MGDVTVDKQESISTVRLLLGFLVEILDPLDTDFTVDPTFFRVAYAGSLVSMLTLPYHTETKYKTHDALRGLFWFQEVEYPFPLKITAGGMEEPLAQIVMITVMFSLLPLRC